MVQTPVLGCEDGGGVDDHPWEQAAALRPHPDLTSQKIDSETAKEKFPSWMFCIAQQKSFTAANLIPVITWAVTGRGVDADRQCQEEGLAKTEEKYFESQEQISHKLLIHRRKSVTPVM